LLALAVANPHVLRVVTMRVYAEQLFFLSSFRNKFNIKRALSAHQSHTLLQKNDSREGLFRCKKGWHVNVGKMNIYLNSLPFAPFSGLFGAKWSVFWCKMECVLVLNGVRFGAKCSAFWC